VVVLSVLLGGVIVGGEDGLGFVEAGLVDQVLVVSRTRFDGDRFCWFPI
jgi:hypothetical protein